MFPTKVLLATDGSDDAALATRIAADLSTRTTAQLHVMHAWHSVPSTRFESFMRAGLEQAAQELLSEQVERIKGARGEVAESYLREGATVGEILDLAESEAQRPCRSEHRNARRLLRTKELITRIS